MQDRAQNTRKKILAAAEWEFSEKGLYGARVDDIARAAGVNKSMLYAYFGSKESLYKTCLLYTSQQLLHTCPSAAGCNKHSRANSGKQQSNCQHDDDQKFVFCKRTDKQLSLIHISK